jgi:hypothetical protein
MSWKMTSREMVLALVLTIVGAGLMAVAIAHRWNPQDMNPGIEGCLTAGVLGFLLCLLHPMSYATAASVTAPLVAVEYAATAVAGGPAVGVVGIQLVIMGMIGLSLGGLTARAPEREAAVQAEATAEARG